MTDALAVNIKGAVSSTGLTRSGIYEALRRGDLTARKCGKRTLILVADLEAFLSRLPTYKAEA